MGIQVHIEGETDDGDSVQLTVTNENLDTTEYVDLYVDRQVTGFTVSLDDLLAAAAAFEKRRAELRTREEHLKAND